MNSILKHLLGFCLLGLLSTSAVAEIIVKDGFVRAMPPSSPNSAAYFSLVNPGEAVTLTSVTTDVAREVQFHTLITENDLVKMRRVNAFQLPAHGTLSLTERGQHLMLLGLTSSLQPGSEVAFTLNFNDGQKLVIALPVAKEAPQTQTDGHHH